MKPADGQTKPPHNALIFVSLLDSVSIRTRSACTSYSGVRFLIFVPHTKESRKEKTRQFHFTSKVVVSTQKLTVINNVHSSSFVPS